MNNVNPSEMKWTSEQALAIKLQGGNILITAAAGSGKTAVLTERLLQRITASKEPADIRRFVVVTFTKPAAAEMKSRLSKKLREYIKEHPENRHAKRQLMYVPEANISTIDSFCLSLIEKYQSVTDKDIGYMPGIRILSESEERLLLDKAIEEVTEAEYAKGEASFYALIDALDTGKTGSDAAVKGAIASVYSMLRLSPEPEKLRCELLSAYAEGYGNIKDNVWLADIYRNLITAARFYLKKANRILTEAPQDSVGEKTISAFLEMLLAVKNDALALEAAAKAEDYAECRRLLSAGITKVKATRNKNYYYEWCSLVYNLKEELKRFWTESASAFTHSEQEIKEEGELLYPIINKLFQIADSTEDRYALLKRERNVWDFSDIELRAKDLLWEKNADGELVRSDISIEEGKNYDEILVDEYQDVNRLQELIFKGICSEREDNLFMVGDVKQSIYGFRGATPELFLERRDEYLLARQEDTEFPAKIALNANFRSRKEITDAVNAVFNAIMKKSTCGMDYLSEDHLNPKASYEPEGHCGAYLTLMSKGQDEAEYVAAKIKELITEKMLVKGEDGNQRPLQYGDIAILLRSTKSNAQQFVQALAGAGVPVCEPVSNGFLNSPSVKKVVSVLCAVDNPMKDINLVAAMTGGMFGFTESELIRIRQNNDGVFYYAVKAAAKNGDKKSALFIEKLEHLRRKASELTAEKFIWYLYKTTGYLSFIKTFDNGKKEYENLISLKEHAKKFGASGRQDLSGYVSHLERLIAKGEKGEGKSSVGENEVKILTVHKSKGLEFPVCFLCRSSNHFSNEASKQRFLSDPSIGVGMRLSIPQKHMLVNTIARKAVLRRLKEKQRCEEMRLLYVAMTRAKERLEIVGQSDFSQELAESSMHLMNAAGVMEDHVVNSARSYIDWLIPVAIGSSVFKLSVSPSWEASVGQSAKSEEAAPDSELVDRIYNSFTAKYPKVSSSAVPSKITVSDIVAAKSQQDGIVYCCERKPACMSTANTSAESGTAFHAFLQFADFSSVFNFEKEIERLVAQRFITKRQAELIDRRKVDVFIKSELFRRILASEKVTREFRFTFEADASEFIVDAPNERLLIQGAVDCIFEENGKCIVLDYKTDRIRGNLTEKIEYYSPQLQIYARALKELTGKEVSEGILYFLDADEAVRIW